MDGRSKSTAISLDETDEGPEGEVADEVHATPGPAGRPSGKGVVSGLYQRRALSNSGADHEVLVPSSRASTPVKRSRRPRRAATRAVAESRESSPVRRLGGKENSSGEMSQPATSYSGRVVPPSPILREVSTLVYTYLYI